MKHDALVFFGVAAACVVIFIVLAVRQFHLEVALHNARDGRQALLDELTRTQTSYGTTLKELIEAREAADLWQKAYVEQSLWHGQHPCKCKKDVGHELPQFGDGLRIH